MPAAKRHPSGSSAFTLLEVIVAVGIFAIGMGAVFGLFTPVAKSVADSADAEAAARIVDLVKIKLQSQGIVGVAPLLKVATGRTHQLTDADARNNYNIAADSQLLFASRDGTKVGTYSDPIWVDPATRQRSDRDKYFEIALIRNEAISPNNASLDATAPVLAYTARVRWPAFVPLAGGTTAIQVGANPGTSVPYDHSQKQVMFFSGTVTR